MPSLRRVELRGIDLDADSLAWVRSTPQLERLSLLDGSISGDALADIVHARKLQSLTLGDWESSGSDDSVTITRPTRSSRVDNIKQLTLVSSELTVELDLRDTPIDDDWLSHLAELHRLKVVRIGECKNLTEKAKAAFRAKRPNVTLDEQTVHRPEL